MFEQMNYITASPFFVGIMVLLLNVGSRYITHEFSDSDDEYSQNIILRRLAIFAACFTATRDLVVSIILTASFVILSSGFLRGKSILAREGMKNPDLAMRSAAGLSGKIDAPAYDTKTEPIA